MARPKKPGELYYLGRVRVGPGEPAALREFVAQFAGAGQSRKLALLRELLAGGGWQPGPAVEAGTEDAETSAILDDLLGGL